MAQPTKKSCPTQLIPTDPIDLTNLLDLIDPISPIENDTFWRIKELVSEALVGGAEPGVSAGADRQGDPQAVIDPPIDPSVRSIFRSTQASVQNDFWYSAKTISGTRVGGRTDRPVHRLVDPIDRSIGPGVCSK